MKFVQIPFNEADKVLEAGKTAPVRGQQQQQTHRQSRSSPSAGVVGLIEDLIEEGSKKKKSSGKYAEEDSSLANGKKKTFLEQPKLTGIVGSKKEGDLENPYRHEVGLCYYYALQGVFPRYVRMYYLNIRQLDTFSLVAILFYMLQLLH